jgi:hypothetical protein
MLDWDRDALETILVLLRNDVDALAMSHCCSQLYRTIYDLKQHPRFRLCISDIFQSVHRLKWVMECGYICSVTTCEKAATAGCLDMLKLLHLHPSFQWSEHACFDVAYEGHLHVLQWSHEQGLPCPMWPNMCANAAKGGHTHVLEWLRGLDPPCHWHHDTCAMAAEGGHLAPMKWALEHGCTWNREWCEATARERGHVTMIDWIQACAY